MGEDCKEELEGTGFRVPSRLPLHVPSRIPIMGSIEVWGVRFRVRVVRRHLAEGS